MVKRTLAAALVAATMAGGAVAQTQSPGLGERIETLSSNPDANRFELGLLTTLRAVEKVVQARYDYGLDNRTLALPLLRLPMGAPRTSRPKQATPETFREVLKVFLADISEARRLVAADEGTAFELTVTELWLDINGNGAKDKGEGVDEVLAPVVFGRQGLRDWQKSPLYGQPITVRFDAADRAWLAAYTHMLSGLGHAAMAFDPTPVFRQLAEGKAQLAAAPEIPNFYDRAEVEAEIAALEAEQERLQAAQKSDGDETRERETTLREESRQIDKELRTPEVKADKDKQAELKARRLEINDELQDVRTERNRIARNLRVIRNEIASARAKLPLTAGGGLQEQLDAIVAALEAAGEDLQRVSAEEDRLGARRKALRDGQTSDTPSEEWAETEAEIALLKREEADASARKAALRNKLADLRKMRREVERQMLMSTGTRPVSRQTTRLIDALYILVTALEQQPDPAHVRAALDNWRGMIDENRRFWTLLDQETDNDHEWIPNARQSAALPLEIEPRVAKAWQEILADAEAVLDGKLLIPHPLLPAGHGISLSSYETDPTPLDLLGLIQGAAIYAHVAKGPRITAQSWRQFQRLTGGRAAGFALFFN